MRLVPEIFEAVESGNLFGDQAPNGRVSVEPYWQLRTTNTIYGDSNRGPYRYYDDGFAVEYEVPSVKSININRSTDQDVATCQIQIYNMWHEANEANPQLLGQLGEPGYFWPKRGVGDSSSTWSQSPGHGAYRTNGLFYPAFSWQDVLVEDALIRTYQGYGGVPEDGNFVSIEQNLAAGNVVLTGVWLVDTVTAGSDGLMTLNCRDVGRLLLEQIIFPPLVPSALYPLEYFPEGKSAFDSFWGAKTNGTRPASKGEVLAGPYAYSGVADGSVFYDYPLINAVDGNNSTYVLSEAYSNPNNAVWFEFNPNSIATEISFRTWAGGYTCYISIQEALSWVSGPAGPHGVPYIKKINIPHAIPDNMEEWITVQLKDVDDQTSPAAEYAVDKVRLTFEGLYYSHVPNGDGHRYRAGVRDFKCYRTGDKVSPYSPNFASLPWTFALEQHPTRGYWVCDDSGNVYGFGDAADYDSTNVSFGQVPLGVYGANNKAVAMAAHPSGKGYWVLDWQGHVYAYGAATHRYNSTGLVEVYIGDPYVPLGTNEKLQAVDIASTYTGNGYWVLYSNGVVHGFGDAVPEYVQTPSNNVAVYMEAFLRNNYAPGTYHPYIGVQMGKAIASHPHKIGFWTCDGSGQVWAYGACSFKGQLYNRVYHKGLSDEFRLGELEWATAMESTASGEGYWIAFGSGKLAAFGDAIDQGPVDIYEAVRPIEDNLVVDPSDIFDPAFFRSLIWGIARDPDGSGFWYMTADGSIGWYDAEFWGQPGYHGATGFRWHAGNFDGDYTQIVKELLMWSGFLFYDAGITGSESPSVLGRMESTGIKTDTRISPDRFDKKFVIDAIRELAEVVGYHFYVTEEGGVNFASPNWWASGNRDENGEIIYVQPGTFIEGTSSDEKFIPVIHESKDMLNYSATLSSADKRSELIIGLEQPNPQYPDRTDYVRHSPPAATEVLSNGVPSMRGIQRPGIWVNNLFENLEEARIMAELIGIHAWFAQRTGTTTAVANPCISLDDQVRLVERNTSETYIHLVRGIDTTMDLDAGTYTMDLTTHWLGDADEWVLTDDPAPGQDIYVRISERLNRWQNETNRGLGSVWTGSDRGLTQVTGEFDSAIAEVSSANAQWGLYQKTFLASGAGDTDAFAYTNFMVMGNGISWPPTDSFAFDGTLAQVLVDERESILTLYACPVDYQGVAADGGPDETDPTPFVDELVDIVSDAGIFRVIVWHDMDVFDYDTTRYMDFYNEVYAAMKAANPAIQVYGPNVELSPLSQGYDTVYNGVTVDSRRMDWIVDFLNDADGYDGVAFSGQFSDSDWADLVTYIKTSHTGSSPLLVSMRSTSTASPTQLHDVLDSADIALFPSDEAFARPYDVDESGQWLFEGSFQLDSVSENFTVQTLIQSDILGDTSTIRIYNDSENLIYNGNLPSEGDSLTIGNLGTPGTVENFTFRVRGNPVGIGNGQLRLKFGGEDDNPLSVQDSILILEG